MPWKTNKWVRYLEGYCKGKNQIQDEYVRKVASNLGLSGPLSIDFEWQRQITERFESNDNNEVIILTGTAGDGKTKLCRDIVKQVEGEHFDENEWNANSFFITPERTVVKDFSELPFDITILVLKELSEVLVNGGSTKPILIAVNDGILVEELDKYIASESIDVAKKAARQLKEIIEDKINLGFSRSENQELIRLVNLSKLNAKKNFSQILDVILSHSGWADCNECEGSKNKTCPIFNKYQLLKSQTHIRENLSNLILLLQLNNEHFTIRELLNLASNTLLASVPKAKHLKVHSIETSQSTLSCNKIKRIEDHDRLCNESTLEVGFWGMNLGPHKMITTRPYSEINSLNFGELSTNYWDKYLKNVNGRTMKLPFDGYNELLNSAKSTTMDIPTELWGAVVRRSRIHLYCYQQSDAKAYNLQRFASFSYYKRKVFDVLQSRDACRDVELINLIILALNRVFHGRLVSESSGRDRLFIPEKGLGSISPVSIFHGDELRERDIYITKIKGDFDVEGARIEPVIIFQLDNRQELKLALTVELFDFLFLVAHGAPPNTTNPRLYKKLLIFRSKLASQFHKQSTMSGHRIDAYTINNGDFRSAPLRVNHE